MTADDARNDLLSLADPERARSLAWFFKTGPGDYGEGDRFLGIRVPAIRRVAKRYAGLPIDQVIHLLKSEYHEQRLLAVLILVRQYERGDQKTRDAVFRAYMDNLEWVNNWDLVDASAERIVGEHLGAGDRTLLYDLADSSILWERRVAVVATFAYIKNDDFNDTLQLAEHLLTDDQDLIHKAVGWMLRELGKRDRARLEDFIDRHHEYMPRTMLRYAMEHFPEEQRRKYVDPDRPRRATPSDLAATESTAPTPGTDG